MDATFKCREIQEKKLFKGADKHRAEGYTIPAVSRDPNNRTACESLKIFPNAAHLFPTNPITCRVCIVCSV
jgi:hypothetical protein